MVLTTAGISVRGRSRQGAEVHKSIGNRKLEIVTYSMDEVQAFVVSMYQSSIFNIVFDEGSASWGNQP